MPTKEKLETSVWVGKEGVKEGQINTIKAHLKRHTYIKVKVQKSIKDQLSTIIGQILSKTPTVLVKKIGFTFTLKKRE